MIVEWIVPCLHSDSVTLEKVLHDVCDLTTIDRQKRVYDLHTYSNILDTIEVCVRAELDFKNDMSNDDDDDDDDNNKKSCSARNSRCTRFQNWTT